ncbi:hypothetical protein F5984_21740 [Rudanella paleaurantiibacter]|uniref:TraB/GumN family protein n=1 Tax=Rudanella paleaurantiibacter TaxID=2614655 RepID=A0A7J5TTP7_9BACT|nr:DUF5694 domain-containing protein [Rudanella paleaurantiibacter]KAB7727255.1 hypothetical protein F5984_21740 [Rudanella paleaurantiibacter]
MTHLLGKVALVFLFLSSRTPVALAQEAPSAQVMIVGFDHLNQLYNNQPQSDVYSTKKQAELTKLNNCLMEYAPDMILVEVDPSEQSRIDSLYQLFSTDKLSLSEIKEGRSETFQVGFVLAKRLKHKRVYCADHYEATAQSLLAEGENIEVFRQGLQQLQGLARPLKKQVQQDSVSVYDYITRLNQPDLISFTHRLFYNLPAAVVDGEFSKTATNTVDVSKVDKRYIGAEYISLFYNRNLKIYSNALRYQRQYQGKRLLLMFGVTHVGVLQELYRVNPAYELVSPLSYCR